MKRMFLGSIGWVIAVSTVAQQETLDQITYTPPADWKKDIQQSGIVYSTINKKNKTWCQVAIYKATTTKGSIDEDFDSEWNVIVKPLGVTDEPQLSEVQDVDGWKIKNGTGSFAFNGSTASSSLTTISGYNICLSILANTNSSDYTQNINDFISSVQLNKPAPSQGVSETTPAETQNNSVQQPTPGFKDNYAFNTTNFDDGWTSTVQEDWVEVTKGNIKVLLHYPKEGTIFPADPEPLTKAAWNILIAPRYSNLKNFKTTYISTYNRPYLAMGNLTENATQREVYIVFFRQSAGWTEVVSPDKNSFIQQFQFDPETIRWDTNPYILKTLDNMTGRNKFAVAASDLNDAGKWSESFSSNTYYTNIYTGTSAGMSTYTSSQWFEFGSGQSYKWQLAAANTYGGNTSLAQAKGSGTFKSLNNWQLYFTEMEGKPKTYDVYFTALKGKRVLWMNDAQHPGSGIFTGFSKD